MIFSPEKDFRFITIRRGGVLTDENHHLLAIWAAACAEHTLYLFEKEQPEDTRPRFAIEEIRSWVDGKVTMSQSRTAAGHAMAAARDLKGAARYAAYAAGQAAAVAHVAAHELGAAAYAIKAVQSSVSKVQSKMAGKVECEWQRKQLPKEIRDLVLEDERIRNHLCWYVFD